MKTKRLQFPVTVEIPTVCGVKKEDMITKNVLKPEFFQTLRVEGTEILPPEDVEPLCLVHPSQCTKINRNKRYQY